MFLKCNGFVDIKKGKKGEVIASCYANNGAQTAMA